MDKRHILQEIARNARENGGKAPGREKFERETGIKRSVWYPHLWLRWGDALQEAGFSANKLQTAIADEVVLEKYIALIREMGRLPVHGELVRKTRSDPTFPSKDVFAKLGGKKQLVSAIVQYCREHQGYDDVLVLCDQSGVLKRTPEPKKNSSSKIKTGFVYLMQSGRHHKIGRTNSLGPANGNLASKYPCHPRPFTMLKQTIPSGSKPIGTNVSLRNAGKESGSTFLQRTYRRSSDGRSSFDAV